MNKCKDCIYYDHIVQATTGAFEYHICTKNMPRWAFVRNNDNACDEYDNNDGSYHDNTWHCLRCGKPVNEWGLCEKCEALYNSWESVSK